MSREIIRLLTLLDGKHLCARITRPVGQIHQRIQQQTHKNADIKIRIVSKAKKKIKQKLQAHTR